MKKLLFAIMAIVLCVGLIGGAFAYFTDTQASSGNKFTAGYTELMLSNGPSGYVRTPVVIGTGTNLAPGGPAIGTFNVGFQNAGTISGVVTGTMSYDQTLVVADPKVNFTPPNYVEATADQFAQKLVIATAITDGSQGTNVAPYWAQQIADLPGYGWANAIAWGCVVLDSNTINGALPTVYGMSKITLHFWDGYGTKVDLPLAPGLNHWVNGTLKLDKSADNGYENIGLNITVTGTLTSN